MSEPSVAAKDCLLADEPNGDGGLADFTLGCSLDPHYPSGNDADSEDVALAAAAYCRAANSGHVDACTHLAILFHVGKGVKGGKDDAEADRLYRAAAKRGSAHAMCNLAMSKDSSPLERFELTKKAAEAGHLMAMCNLGNLYQETKSFDEAYEWWRKAADLGFPRAQFNVGVALRDGIGVDVDDEESVAWLTKAADAGFGLAKYNLAVALTAGKGVETDIGRAVELYRGEAVAGLGLSAYNLAVLHMGKHDPPIPQDWAEVAKWARHAASLMPHHLQSSALRDLAEGKIGREGAVVEEVPGPPKNEGASELLHSIFQLRLNLNGT